MESFIHTEEGNIIHNGQPVHLRGVNLGGWLMMEGYLMHSLNNPEQSFRKGFSDELGAAELEKLIMTFRDSFVRPDDLARIASWGMNCVRVPFHYQLIETAPRQYSEEGAAYLDRVIDWAAQHNIWVILDLHAACGAQNHDWHGDSLGPADLWHNADYQERTVELWRWLAKRYRDCVTVAGYDILNEAVTDNVTLLNEFYQRVMKAIREEDPNHILFIEGNTWATNLEQITPFDDPNHALSIHFYLPLEYTGNFIPHLQYPLINGEERFDRQAIVRYLEKYVITARQRGVPIFVGEFGINWRGGGFGEQAWLRDVLSIFDQNKFHWTYWTYKSVKNSIFPDGLMSYYANPPWVNRQGPKLGWDMYAACWPNQQQEMTRSWRTDMFAPNDELLNVMKGHLLADENYQCI